ncbi:MAG: hemolysin family protein [Bacteroidia bacterium]|nr:HlyC/CorC family transporter [Bacteroidia bacterium]MCZ2276656.1 hemolysin family protein [Bacteroidia bacterium]
MTTGSIIILTLLFSAFFSGIELAFLTSNKFRIEIDKKQGKLQATILSYFLKRPSWFIGAVLIGNNIALVIYGIYISKELDPIVSHWLPASFDFEGYRLIIQTLISTAIILLFGEFLPKILSRINPNETLALLSIPFLVFYALFYPLVFVILKFSNWLLSKILGVQVSETRPEFGRIDLDVYVKNIQQNTSEEAQLNTELEMFQAALDFSKVKIRNCMVPRHEIVAVEISTPIERIKKLFIETRLSRILIYRESIDNIIGFVHSFEMFRNPQDVLSIMLPVTIFPESTPALQVLKHFTNEHRSVAVVVDEHGLTAGMVTVEDVIEEIFGEIQDEYDLDSHTETRISDSEFIFSGSLEIDYLNEKYGFKIPTGSYETLAGFILFNYESIPEPGQVIEISPFKVKIQTVKSSRIESVRFTIVGGA